MYEFTIHMEIDGNDEDDAKRLYESIVSNLENTPCVWVIDKRRTTDMEGNEYGCDRCGVEVPNGSGHYPEGTDDRVCADCYKEDN